MQWVAVLALLIFVGVLAAVFEWYLKERRQQALRKVAQKIGFTYFPNERGIPAVLRSSFGSYFIEYKGDLLASPGGSRVTEILVGKFDVHQAMILDYEYERKNEGSESVKQTVSCFRLPNASPAFKFRPRRLREKFRARPSSGGLTHQEYSKSYSLNSAEPGAIQLGAAPVVEVS